MKKIDIKKEADNCSKCGICRSACPTFIETEEEAFVARARIHLAGEVASGSDIPKDKFKEVMESCLLCMRCTEYCPSDIDTASIVFSSKNKIIQNGDRAFKEAFLMKYLVSRRLPLKYAIKSLGLADSFTSMLNAGPLASKTLAKLSGVSSNMNLPKFTTKSIFDTMPEKITLPGNTKEVTYFPGCSSAFFFQNTASAIIKVLLRAGYNVNLPKIGCCSMPVYATGDIKSAKKIASDTLKRLKNSGSSTIITGCGSCGYMLSTIYTEMFENTGLNVIDISRFIQENNIKPGNKTVEHIVTYHDPCHLKRGMGISEEPRNILKTIPGIEFREMEDADMCCGGGGTFSIRNHALSLKIAEKKVNMFKRTKSELLATGCPLCRMHIRDAFTNFNCSGGIVHPVELLAFTYDE